jgi:hypothetical protein
MTNASFTTYPASKYAGSQNGHYNTPLIPWFRATGHPSEYPDAFTADIGSTRFFDVNVDGSSFIKNKTNPFWPQEGDFNHGFSLKTTPTVDYFQFNYKLSGGQGPWMPCPIFRSISWYWSKETNVQNAWYLKHIGLVLKNWKTDEEKTWGDTLNNSNSDSRVMFVNTASSINVVRSLGPDWFIYGVIFNFVSPTSSINQVAESRLVDFRLGYECDGLTGTNRLVLPKLMSFNNLKTALNAGQMKYEPIST